MTILEMKHTTNQRPNQKSPITLIFKNSIFKKSVQKIYSENGSVSHTLQK